MLGHGALLVERRCKEAEGCTMGASKAKEWDNGLVVELLNPRQKMKNLQKNQQG